MSLKESLRVELNEFKKCFNYQYLAEIANSLIERNLFHKAVGILILVYTPVFLKEIFVTAIFITLLTFFFFKNTKQFYIRTIIIFLFSVYRIFPLYFISNIIMIPLFFLIMIALKKILEFLSKENTKLINLLFFFCFFKLYYLISTKVFSKIIEDKFTMSNAQNPSEIFKKNNLKLKKIHSTLKEYTHQKITPSYIMILFLTEYFFIYLISIKAFALLFIIINILRTMFPIFLIIFLFLHVDILLPILIF